MSSQTAQPPAISIADPPSQGDDAAVPELASLSVSDGGDTLSPFATINQKYSIVQPGVLLTELQPELDGKLVKSGPALTRGGHADVYKGLWTGPDEKPIQVAIKVLRLAIPTSMTTDRERLRKRIDILMKRETLIWIRAKHPNIHTFIGFRMRDEPQLISPWCAEGNLGDYLIRNATLPRDKRLSLINQAALGLAYLHSRTPPICHADIKPENILINDSGEAALSDFGVSRVLDSLAEHTGLTTTGGPNLTYPYTAPELFDPELIGEEDSVPRPSCESDVYAFGGLILAVMSGKAPFHGIKHSPAIMRKICGGATPNPKVHEQLKENDPLWDVMKSCWQFKPSDRPSMPGVLEMVCPH
ncbi:hypothetical protein FRC04_005268 [Tulasnella sp. 424]|nr:hypothetical protein FRC04_005268 [Tulasnella sp. 424]